MRPVSTKLRRNTTLAVAAVSLLAIGLAACGGSNDSSNSTTSAAAATTGTAGGTVATKSVSGVGTVLVDSNGNALYTNDMDTASKVACTGECTAIWPPLTAPSGGQPTSGNSAVQAKLGVTKSGNQVTYAGKPLYTFVQDGSPGQVNGNGVMDSFGGTNFTWTAATTTGTAGSGGGAAPTTTSSSGGGGGYGY